MPSCIQLIHRIYDLQLTGHTLCQNVRHLAARGQNSHAHVVHNKNLNTHKMNRGYKFSVTEIKI